MTNVVTLTDQEVNLVRAIVMDGDGPQALLFLKDKILKPLDESRRKGMDTSKGHL